MKKINAIQQNKIWGYEIWLHCPLPGFETTDEEGIKTTSGPLLKIIKTHQPLSVQVHPDDALAKELENAPNGKSESWYVIEQGATSKLVMGLTTFDEQTIRKALANKTFTSLLKQVQPVTGGFYNIPAGLVHGIGANLTIFELQQPSNITYRYFDYDRRDQNGSYRELHINKAIKAQKNLSYKLRPLGTSPLTYQNGIATQEFHSTPSVLKQDALVVDLGHYVCYQAIKGEAISFANYVVVHSFG